MKVFGASPEWIDAGTYLSPVDGATKDVAIGGANNSNARFTLHSNKQIGGYFDTSGTQDVQMIAFKSRVSNNSTVNTSFTTGFINEVINSGTGISYGIDNRVYGAGNGNHIGLSNGISGEGFGAHKAVYNLLSGTGSGDQVGLENSIIVDADGVHTGTINSITGNGNGLHIGNSAYLTGIGTGPKYGSSVFISNTAGGQHYGFYSNVLKTGSYAAYFLGNVAIGTDAANIYNLPASRGTVNQVMQTDGSGNVSWVYPSPGVHKIDDLSDGKSDSDGSNDGSSVFLGIYAGLLDDSSDNKNVAIGYNALRGVTNGAENVAIGHQAKQLSVSGDGNVAIGANAGYNNYGNDNVSIGRDTGPGMNDDASGNISIGTLAGSGLGVLGPSVPNGNILIGYQANPISTSGSNQLNIGNFLWANTINGSSVGGYFTGKLGGGYYNPTSTLHVGGDIRMDFPANGHHWRTYIDTVDDYNFEYNGTLKSYINDTDGSYNIFSDRRLKRNIKAEEISIVDKVLKLNPVNYEYISDATNTLQHGFIAQEVQALFPELVNEKKTAEGTFLSLNYQAFGVLAIKTIQEQQTEIESLKREISELKNLEERIKKLEMR